jgi:hypothetical protein
MNFIRLLKSLWKCIKLRMIGRREFLQGVIAAAAVSQARADVPRATVAMTFDTDVTTYWNAFFDMRSKGIVGTFFADSDRVGHRGWPVRADLASMASGGWEIGVRACGILDGAEVNMVALCQAEGEAAARERMRAQKNAMRDIGFDVKSAAAGQRAWSPQLASMASVLFDNVRVADRTVWGRYPIIDRRYVREGGTESWGGNDTVASLCAQLDAVIADGGIWLPVIHRVDDQGDPNYTVPIAVFEGFTSYLQAKIADGRVRAVTFAKAMDPV